MTETTRLTVRLAQDSDLTAWQAFVDASPEAGCMHHAGWFKILRDAYWVTPYFLLAVDDDAAVVGILPTYRSRSLLTGSHVSSLEGGVLARRPEVTRALIAAARELRDRVGAKYLQIRGGPVEEDAAVTASTVRTSIPTGDGEAAAWSAVKKKTRWGVRQATKEDVTIEHDPELAALDEFYRIYAAHMRTLGTPVVGRDGFRAMREHLGRARLRLYLVRHRGRLIGGMLCIVNADRWTDYHAIVRPAPATEFANYALYWHVIRDACLHGVPCLDLGRSVPDSNVHLFKRKWGGLDSEALYHFYPAPHASPRDMGLEAMKRGKSVSQRVWSHLPLSVSNRLGPLLRKQLPFI
jgi:FemAB-related protein (PEP-CTERM system-associated)